MTTNYNLHSPRRPHYKDGSWTKTEDITWVRLYRYEMYRYLVIHIDIWVIVFEVRKTAFTKALSQENGWYYRKIKKVNPKPNAWGGKLEEVRSK